MSDQVEDAVEETVEAVAEASEVPSLGVADLNLMANVIEAVAQRGAIRANEMQAVGVLYNRLMAFLIANGARPVPGAAPVADEAVEETAEAGEADNA